MIEFLRRLFRGRDTLAQIDSLTFMRWLEAGRPPIDQFCRRPEEEQESLALLGLSYVRAQALAHAKALRDPELWQAEHFGTAKEFEEAVCARAAEGAYAEFAGAEGPSRFEGLPPALAADPRVNPQTSMAGALADRAADERDARMDRNRRLRSSLQPASHDNSEAKT